MYRLLLAAVAATTFLCVSLPGFCIPQESVNDIEQYRAGALIEGLDFFEALDGVFIISGMFAFADQVIQRHIGTLAILKAISTEGLFSPRSYLPMISLEAPAALARSACPQFLRLRSSTILPPMSIIFC